MLALAGLVAIHCPPPLLLVNVTDSPAHTAIGPVIVAAGSTVTVVDTLHKVAAGSPELIVYVIVAVPATQPVTTPFASTDATPSLLLLHVPPAGVLLNCVVEPSHTEVLP